ncbi:MAG: septum formation initiator family protein [Desulfuromonadales bacterium]|nr:septum formation initiator family protein [Desulfuromonadales bacterium]
MSDPDRVPSPSGRRFPVIPALLILLLLGFAIFGDRGILRALQFSRQKAGLEAQVHQLETENTALRSEIEALRSDRRTLEGIARRELGMVKEDELVYQFRPAERPPEQMKKP